MAGTTSELRAVDALLRDVTSWNLTLPGNATRRLRLRANDARAAVPIAAFQALYAVEEAVRDADDETRREERQRRSKPVYDELVAW